MESRKFAKILRRYRLGEATEAEKALVEQWYDLLEEGHTGVMETGEAALQARIWDRVTAEIQSADKNEIIPQRVFIYRYWKVFSSLAAAVVIGLVLWLGGFLPAIPGGEAMVKTEVPTGNFKTYFNDANTSKTIILEDSSVITLAPGASLNVPAKFQDERREVYLTGEAFFEVAKNPARPFFVYSGRVTTHVLGTSFNIKPIGDGRQVEITVRTGRVEVFESLGDNKSPNARRSKGVVLTPNQKVVYHESSGSFEPSVANMPLPLIAEDQAAHIEPVFVFSETPLKEVLNALEITYGIEIMVERKSLNDCPFTGDISDQNLYQKLDIINKVLGTSYEVKGTRILIKGNGCE